ncbi:hypothetical protein [Aestuariirhabdus litorea]|uniref:Uncharacterized protein n=1 Tax=Aestuariirhabdus litorea TaxID=2528527 RepID=A0A3P3VS29_9GAMM|nr:hypothetical protein [Aestuariirhabdus litorea]RRJ84506.1 hypothetical protein D0544_05210 [Aestuariirhabdus litorea]RWW97731.1 hypothetical protein DZC74_05205 [Endozoicomonadaceae bacterium GTF-13]
MLLDYFDPEYTMLCIGLLVAIIMLGLCLQEYDSIKAFEREIEEDLKNPPKPIYQHDLKAFSQDDNSQDKR